MSWAHCSSKSSYSYFTDLKGDIKISVAQENFVFVGQLFQTPGPGAYSPEKAPPMNAHRRPPSYTMSTRTRYRTVDDIPAPNRYARGNQSLME